MSSQTFRWALAGVVAGVGGAFLATRAAQAAVPGLLPLDALTVASIRAAYLVVVITAMGLATLRALRIDPAAALRTE